MHGNRSAGILLHIISLPSRFGIGDLGPEAYAFADFMASGHQRHWQLLPLNPVVKSQGYSPYSSLSSMARNPLLISPELLAKEGLLAKNVLKKFDVASHGRVNYTKAALCKERIIQLTFQLGKRSPEFADFCRREDYWLDDFALFMALKAHFSNEPWFLWPSEFRRRNEERLHAFRRGNEAEISRIKWSQFVFFRQWSALRERCHHVGVRLLGDLPFYISHDSADVWSRPEIFRLKKDGSMAGIAGVPPDYFNDKGQLWGMPVFRWDVLRRQGYDWWIRRIRKNLEMFDELRLDHFRAFSDYWEVPANEQTAINGKWRKGPGGELFTVLQKEFGKLPFVAEDLGDISAEVRKLRNRVGLPGMKVLQFAFGDDMGHSEHIPHNFEKNFVVYTGTHDNNTTCGWFRKDISRKIQGQLALYAGHAVRANNVHITLARMAYASTADTAIIPVQDLLGLGPKARMNTPASLTGNWQWRLKKRLPRKMAKSLREWTTLHGRA